MRITCAVLSDITKSNAIDSCHHFMCTSCAVWYSDSLFYLLLLQQRNLNRPHHKVLHHVFYAVPLHSKVVKWACKEGDRFQDHKVKWPSNPLKLISFSPPTAQTRSHLCANQKLLFLSLRLSAKTLPSEQNKRIIFIKHVTFCVCVCVCGGRTLYFLPKGTKEKLKCDECSVCL